MVDRFRFLCFRVIEDFSIDEEKFIFDGESDPVLMEVIGIALLELS